MKFKNYPKSFLFIAVVVIAGLFSFNNPEDKFFAISKNLDIFATLVKEINTYYVDEINPNKLIRVGIDAMLESLDPYTNYIPEDDIEDYRTMTTGQYGGIGALIGRKNSKNVVVMPYKGFPAHKAGLVIGDEILKVDDQDVTKKNTGEISKLLKGQANSPLKLTVRRFGVDKDIDITLKREKITINNVPYYGMVTEDVGYIKLSDFTFDAGKEVKKALQEVKSQGAKKVILDLRDNPGGLLSEAVNISNIFIPKGAEVVSTKGKIQEWNKTYRALDNPTDLDIPIAVLTSNRSASASEIVAGVIQDYDRGVVIGQKTFGKGLVQATRPLTYNSQLKVTTAKYYTPSGRCIQAIDYAQRNEDGSVGKVPDSLKVVFKTKNSRLVYDGGGIDPDIAVDRKSYSAISVSLVAKGLLFDYATLFYYKNSKIDSAKDFEISDEEYKKFTNWLKDKDYDYVTKVEKTIDDLITTAQNEKYYDDIKAQIYDLKNKVHHNKDQDLQKFKDEIRQLLKEEIVARYYLREGIIEASFSHDPDVQEAVRVLTNIPQYKDLLSLNK
jgi:carboxyl-terminal processing protease